MNFHTLYRPISAVVELCERIATQCMALLAKLFCVHLQNEALEELELHQKAAHPPPDLSAYLQAVGIMELRYIRMLSSLCSQTYFMNKLTVGDHLP